MSIGICTARGSIQDTVTDRDRPSCTFRFKVPANTNSTHIKLPVSRSLIKGMLVTFAEIHSDYSIATTQDYPWAMKPTVVVADGLASISNQSSTGIKRFLNNNARTFAVNSTSTDKVLVMKVYGMIRTLQSSRHATSGYRSFLTSAKLRNTHMINTIGLFKDCTSLTHLGLVGGIMSKHTIEQRYDQFNGNQVTSSFKGCTSLVFGNGPFLMETGRCRHFINLFNNCINNRTHTLNLPKILSLASVTDMSYMFASNWRGFMRSNPFTILGLKYTDTNNTPSVNWCRAIMYNTKFTEGSSANQNTEGEVAQADFIRWLVELYEDGMPAPSVTVNIGQGRAAYQDSKGNLTQSNVNTLTSNGWTLRMGTINNA